MKKATYALLAICLMMTLALSSTAKNFSLRADSDRLKAEYLFLEYERQTAMGNRDIAHQLINRAFQLDSIDPEIGYFFATSDLCNPELTERRMNHDIYLVRRMVDAHPDLLNQAKTYLLICSNIRNIDEVIRTMELIDSIHPEEEENSGQLAETLLLFPDDSVRIKKAFAILDRIERTTGDPTSPAIAKVNFYLQNGRIDDATSTIDSLLKKAPKSESALIAAAKVYSYIDSNSVADSLYQIAIASEPPSGYALYSYANHLYSRGDTTGYEREIDKALRQDNLDIDIKLEMLTRFTKKLISDTTQLNRIDGLFSVMLEQHPLEAELHDLYASYLYTTKRYAQAAEEYSYVLDSDPSDLDRWLSVLSIYNQADQFDKSTQAGLRALDYFPDEPRLLYMISSQYGILRQYDKAIEYLQSTIAHADTTDTRMLSQYNSSMGDIYQNIEAVDSACFYYDKALLLAPDNILALNNYAYFLSTIGKDLDRALEMSLKTINAEPDNSTYVDTYAWILFKKGDYFQARQYIDKVLVDDLYEKTDEVYDHAAQIYEKLGDKEKAAHFAQLAIAEKNKKENELAAINERVTAKTNGTTTSPATKKTQKKNKKSAPRKK